MTQVIGQVQRIDLVIQQGGDRIFDVVWYDSAGTPVPIRAPGYDIDIGVVSQVRTAPGGAVLLDIGDNTTLDEDGYTMHVAIPASVTSVLAPNPDAAWSFIAIATSGEEKVLMQGQARIMPAISS